MNEKKTISSVMGIAVILIVATGIGGYIYWQSRMVEDTEVTPSSVPSGLKAYRNEEFTIAFQYPDDWEIEERHGRRPSDPSQAVSPTGERHLPLQRDNSVGEVEDPEVMKFQILLSGSLGESVTITIFPKPTNLEDWIKHTDPQALQESRLSLDRPNALVDGLQGYIWQTVEGVQEGALLVFIGDAYLYQVGFPTDGPGREKIGHLLHSISTGVGGQTILPDDIWSI